jgi:type III restriction enzyme
VPAINNHGGYGRWGFVEVTDPWEAKKTIREYLRQRASTRITKTPGVCGGVACVQGTRIPVWLLVALRRQGASEEELLRSYPSLTSADLAAAWKYDEQHKAEVEGDLQRNENA